MNDYISHRCHQLLKHNTETYTPNVIRKLTDPNELDLNLHLDKWNLYHLECDSEYGEEYMESAGIINFCPYCGDKLD